MFFFMLAIFVILASVVVYLITKRGVFSAVGLIVAAALIVLRSTPASTWSSPGSRS